MNKLLSELHGAVVVLCVLIIAAMIFFLAWKAPIVTLALAWMLREMFSTKINRMLK